MSSAPRPSTQQVSRGAATPVDANPTLSYCERSVEGKSVVYLRCRARCSESMGTRGQVRSRLKKPRCQVDAHASEKK